MGLVSTDSHANSDLIVYKYQVSMSETFKSKLWQIPSTPTPKEQINHFGVSERERKKRSLRAEHWGHSDILRLRWEGIFIHAVFLILEIKQWCMFVNR